MAAQDNKDEATRTIEHGLDIAEARNISCTISHVKTIRSEVYPYEKDGSY